MCCCPWLSSISWDEQRLCVIWMQGKPPCCSFIGWMTGCERNGRSTINFPVVGKGHGVTALWSTIKTIRQIGRGGRRSTGEHGKLGQTKTATEMQLHITQSHTKALRQPRDTTATLTQPHWHAHKQKPQRGVCVCVCWGVGGLSVIYKVWKQKKYFLHICR